MILNTFANMFSKRTVPIPKLPLTPAERRAVRVVIASTRPEDYDGHTEFERMSPAERLDWLGTAASFVKNSKRDIRSVHTA